MEGKLHEAIRKKYALLGVDEAKKDYLEFAKTQFIADFFRIKNYSFDDMPLYCPKQGDLSEEEMKSKKPEELAIRILVDTLKVEGLSEIQIAEALINCTQAPLSSISMYCMANGYPIPAVGGAAGGAISVVIDTQKGTIKAAFASLKAMTFDDEIIGIFQGLNTYHYRSGESSFNILKFEGINKKQEVQFLIR